MRTYIHIVEALTKSIASRQSSLFHGQNHGRPCRSTLSRRVVDVAGEPQSSKGPAQQDILLVHLRTVAQGLKALLSHSLKS